MTAGHGVAAALPSAADQRDTSARRSTRRPSWPHGRATGCCARRAIARPTRWVAYLEPLPDQLRDGELGDLRKVGLRARAAYGPKDSVRDALPPEVTEPFLEAIDRLLKELARREVGG